MDRYTNEYAMEKEKKEKEKDATILAIYHETLLATMGYYLQNDTLI